MLVDDRGKSVQLKQGILQRRGRQEYLPNPGQSSLDGLPRVVAFTVGIAQLVRLVDHRQIPANIADGLFHPRREMDGHDADDILIERVVHPVLPRL